MSYDIFDERITVMNTEASFLRAIQENPSDASLRGVFSDWLEERSDPRGELLRLLTKLTESVEVPNRAELEERMRSLLTSGVQPVGPYFTNSIGMTFTLVWPGTFVMGSPEDEEARVIARMQSSSRLPTGNYYETQHKVTLTKGIFLAVQPVNQRCWRDIMGTSPSHFNGDDLPVEQVSWDDCKEFVLRLSDFENCVYHLPTEAEWEYACRAGTTSAFFFGDMISTEDANFNHGDKPRRKTTRPGSFPPNAFGLFDMHGNVSEWCADWRGPYPSTEVIDPMGPQDGDDRIHRGGHFFSLARSIRSGSRNGAWPNLRDSAIGFRPAVALS